MIHLDSVEKAAKRIHTYLNDPEAFGEKLNANRKERLEALYSSLSASIKLLGERLDKSDFVSESTEAIIRCTIKNTVADAVAETVKRIMPISSVQFEEITSDDIPAELSATPIANQISDVQKPPVPPMPRQSCKKIYALFIQTLLVGAEATYSDTMLHDFTAFIWQHFTYRFSAGNKYNIHQIQECITKMFVAFAHGYFSGDRLTFEYQYGAWKRMYESSDSKYICPAYVSCFNIDGLHDDEKEYIKSAWQDLVEGPYSPITRVNIGDPVIRNAFLLSNPFRVWGTDEQKEVNTATQ